MADRPALRLTVLTERWKLATRALPIRRRAKAGRLPGRQTGRHANGHVASRPSRQACRSTYWQTCSPADRRAIMLPVTRRAIVRMGHGLPDKRCAANTIRQGIPNEGSLEPDRPLARTTSQNRPALGDGSNEGDRGSGAQSNRVGWLGRVWKGRSALPCRCASHRRGWPSAGGNPQEDRTQISKPQVKSLHKCALVLYRPTGTR